MLFSGYCMLAREMTTAESRVVFNNMQKELNKEMPAVVDANALQRAAEIKRLKDPFM
jgi:hypothetical protein